MSRLDKLLQKEMTRQQFVLTVLASFASLFGISALLGMLTNEELPKSSEEPGYGVQNYGP